MGECLGCCVLGGVQGRQHKEACGGEEVQPRLGKLETARAWVPRQGTAWCWVARIAQLCHLTSACPAALRCALLQVRSTGKAAPKRLTTHQRQIVGRLLAAHGDDIAAMARDRKLNSMQHPEGVLRALVESYQHWKEGSGVDFRVPHKRLW